MPSRDPARKIGFVVAVFFVLLARSVDAHPLGNFTINHLSHVTVRDGRVDVRYVLDMAEIPTFALLRARGIRLASSPPSLAAIAADEAKTIVAKLQLHVEDRALPLVIDRTSATTRPGAGGLPTFYEVIDAHARFAATRPPPPVTYRDASFEGRIGWHDIVVGAAGEPTHDLTAYPSALLGSPRDTTTVTLTSKAGAYAATSAPIDDTSASTSAGATPSQLRSNTLSDMLARGTSDLGFVALTLVVALALGALHALEPGHGKTLLAISLVGARATVRQAAILAGALTVAHTIGVLALGIAINLFKGYFVPESVYPWITLLSGIAIVIVGARAIRRQIEMRIPVAHVHAHEHDALHPHEHPHVHAIADRGHAHVHADGSHHHHHHEHDDAAHARAHAIPGTAPLRFGATVWAAMSGGIAPCPAALVVLLSAVALDRVAYGIVVIVAFSFGLAATLTGLGIAVVRGASWLAGRPQFERFVAIGPLLSAIFIATIGSLLVGQGFAQQGFASSPLAVSAMVALAVAGFAFSHGFAHRRLETA